jgi:hypothetical protein
MIIEVLVNKYGDVIKLGAILKQVEKRSEESIKSNIYLAKSQMAIVTRPINQPDIH